MSVLRPFNQLAVVVDWDGGVREFADRGNAFLIEGFLEICMTYSSVYYTAGSLDTIIRMIN